MDTSPLWEWVNERHAIYLRKSIREGAEPGVLSQWSNGYLDRPAGDELRWGAKGYKNEMTGSHDAFTRDHILQQYRFCNVFRELDRVTAWIRYNIRRRYADHPDLWLMLCIARTLNWPDTLQYLMDQAVEAAWPGDELGFEPSQLTVALEDWAGQGNKTYTGAYMIRAESNPKAEWYSWSKHRYIAEIVLGRLWEDREVFRDYLKPGVDDSLTPYTPTLRGIWSILQEPRYIGWGPFMAYQAVIDMRHTALLRDAPDIQTWAALGPGSRRGLNRLAGRPVDAPLSQDVGLVEMRMIWAEQDQHRAPWVPPIDLSDIQNALCETDKYLRVKNGEGRPRAQYIPGRGY